MWRRSIGFECSSSGGIMPEVMRSQIAQERSNSSTDGMLYGFAVGLSAVAGVEDRRGKVTGGRSRM